MIFYTNNNKIAGELTNRIYRKKVIRSKHLMKMFNGYGIDYSIVLKLEKEGCNEIRILETDTGIVLSCPFKTFIEKGVKKNFDGIQMFLSGKYWNSENPKQKKLI